MATELISIVIPAYNEKKNIVACLRSIKAQDYQGPLEIIVTDNNSSDNTGDLARQEGATVVFEASPASFMPARPEPWPPAARSSFRPTLTRPIRPIG